jgi:hypothetical protein
MNDTSAILRAHARSTEAEVPGAGATDATASREMAEKTARRRQVLLDLLLDSLTGSRTYVKSYRAGRGAE